MTKTPKTAAKAPKVPPQPQTPAPDQAAVDAAVWAATHDSDGKPKPIRPETGA